MKAPEYEMLTFDKYGGYKFTTKRFWLASATCDAYGKKISEGDRVRVREEMMTYTVEFNGNNFILVDSLGEENARLDDMDSYEMEIVGHVVEEKL